MLVHSEGNKRGDLKQPTKASVFHPENVNISISSVTLIAIVPHPRYALER